MRNQPQTAADELARVFADSTQRSSEELIRRLHDVARSSQLVRHWRSEACAAAWMATRATFDSSILAPTERRELLTALTRHMVPYWQKQCAAGEAATEPAAPHPGSYDSLSRPGNLPATARLIAAEVLRSTGADSTPVSRAAELLADALVERMADDLRRLNEYKGKRHRL